MKEKIVVAIASAALSGSITIVSMTANWAGRLTSVEKGIERIELRLDSLAVAAGK